MNSLSFFPSKFQDIHTSLFDGRQDLSPINEVEMRQGCISIVNQFHDEGLFEEYATTGLEGRMHIADLFFKRISNMMGIDTEFNFVPLPYSTEGGYNPSTKTIDLSMKSLENPDCTSLLNTILHELRHAFQHRAILYPESVSTDKIQIDAWRFNFDNYISPSLDYEAYRNQPIEADAFDYADKLVPEYCEELPFSKVDNKQEFLNSPLV